MLLLAARSASAFLTTTRYAAATCRSAFPQSNTQYFMAAGISGGGERPRVYEEGQVKTRGARAREREEGRIVDAVGHGLQIKTCGHNFEINARSNLAI